MKKFRKIMAILVAAVMIVAMAVPAWATTTKGRLDGITEEGYDPMPKSGTITINNVEDGETYNIYKIFDLYSFSDDNVNTSQHSANERYSYMIASTSPWFTFIDTYYRKGSASAHSETEGSAFDHQYFTIDKNNPVYLKSDFTSGTLADGDTLYYFVEPDETLFANTVTPAASIDEATRASYIATNAKVQAFAQDAIKWAQRIDPYDVTHVPANTSPVPAQVTIKDARMANMATNSTVPTGSAVSNTGSNNGIQITNMSLGYYLVDSTIGTLVSLDTNNPNATMMDKNETPTITKHVKARLRSDVARVPATKAYPTDGDAIWVKNADYEIGSTVKFKIEISVPKGAKDYVLHDVMEDGFDLVTTGTNNDATNFSVYVRHSDGTYVDQVYTASSSTFAITVAEADLDDGCDFEIAFDNIWLSGLAERDVIEVEYSAKLNKSAVIFGDAEAPSASNPTTILSHATLDNYATSIEGDPDAQTGINQIEQNNNTDGKNTNSAVLTFGVNSARTDATDYVKTTDGFSKWAVATVDTFQFDLVKTEEGSTPFKLLGGAEFALYAPDTSDETKPAATPLVLVSDTTKSASNTMANVYRRPDATESSEDNTKIVTTSTKAVNIEGLHAGTYYLKETKAPTGYNKIDGFWKIVITGDANTNNVNTSESASGVGDFKVTYTNGAGNVVGDANVDRAWKATITVGTPSTYATATNGGLQVINNYSTELPSTGGMGTTVLYIVGGMLVILAGAYLFFSRKRTA